MLTKEYQFICDEVLKIVESDFSGDIVKEDYENGIHVKFDGTNAVIGCSRKPHFARGIFLLAQNYKKGPFEITQKPNFDALSNSLDMARNGVFTVDGIRKWITYSAALGFTGFSMNTEDLYELEGYPRHGYMRGRYSKEDLKAIVEYCDAFGMTTGPSVQSLGHRGQYLQWGEARPIKDTAQCLLVDEPKTYEFLEKSYALMRECYPNATGIGVSLSESHDLGTGRFMDLHGYEPRSAIYGRHAKRVAELCEKYGFKSKTMSGDMFFRMKSKSRNYYDPEVELSAEDAKNIDKDMEIMYWDYYHTKKEDYKHYIEQHRRLGRRLVLKSAIWTWEGYIEDTNFTIATAIPFLQAAIEMGERRFSVGTYGDYGTECSFMRSIGSLAIYSEYCYRGLDCTMEDICEASEFLTKMPYKNMMEIGKIHSDYHDDYRFAAKVMCGDMFYNFVNIQYDYAKAREDIAYAAKKAKEYMEQNDRHHDYYEYCYYCAKLTLLKLDLINKIRPAYENGDKEYLRQAAEKDIPEFVKDMYTFMELFKKEWLRDKKSMGIEVVLIRLAGAAAQAHLRAQQITSYLNGETDKILELEEKLIEDKEKVWEYRLFSASEWKI